jgi:hypothetical protein
MECKTPECGSLSHHLHRSLWDTWYISGPDITYSLYCSVRIITWHKQGDQTEEQTNKVKHFNISKGKMEQWMDVREKCELLWSGSQLALILRFVVNSVHPHPTHIKSIYFPHHKPKREQIYYEIYSALLGDSFPWDKRQLQAGTWPLTSI